MRAAGAFSSSLGDVARPLADRQFRWLWFATFAWNFARWMEMTVTSWVALELTGSAWLVAVVGVCRNAFLPVAGPITGALSDRFDRVRLIKTAQWGNVLVIGAVAVALLAGQGAYWQLVIASLWLGASWGLDWPSRRALMADMVGPERVLQGVVLDTSPASSAHSSPGICSTRRAVLARTRASPWPSCSPRSPCCPSAAPTRGASR
jgi:MFS family permease